MAAALLPGRPGGRSAGWPVGSLEGRRTRQAVEERAAHGRVYLVAVSVPCPTCAAEVGEGCVNLTRRRAGMDVATVSPQAKTPPADYHPETAAFDL